MKKVFILFSFLLVVFSIKGQTVIEMMYPADATVVLLEVKDIKDADIVVYKTEDKAEANEWDCKWMFKKWGFSNFSVYITPNQNDSLLYDEEQGKLGFDGKIFFTTNPNQRGYKDKDFRLEGVFRKVSVDDIEW